MKFVLMALWVGNQIRNAITLRSVKNNILTMIIIKTYKFYFDFQEDAYKKIYLHAKDIAIDEESVTVKLLDGSKTFEVVGHEYGFERDFYVIHLKEDLPLDVDLTLDIR